MENVRLDVTALRDPEFLHHALREVSVKAELLPMHQAANHVQEVDIVALLDQLWLLKHLLAVLDTSVLVAHPLLLLMLRAQTAILVLLDISVWKVLCMKLVVLWGITTPFLPRHHGHYCSNGTSNAIPCPEGTFTQSENLTSADECSYCMTGSYCATAGLTEPTGPCAAGYYCERGAISPNPSSSDMYPSNGPCIVEHYCPSGTVAPIPCPIGTFLDTTGGFNVSSCRSCVGGSFCNTSGLTSPTGFCSPGFYCPEGSTVYQPLEYVCPAGMFCPEGSTLPMSCPPGEYQQRTMQAQCELCPEGRTCVNSTADPALCPPHHYCPRGTGVNPPMCPPGTFTYDNTTGLVLPSSCLPCETGRYCRNGVSSGN